ncbi:hypothetical protein [Acetobacter thailandicus]|uniref:hypothetical protein n=1 Tax=Acetobacter thailandicus TaxID=1502842 RepID=UPI001BA789C7|nr:hypothetical protein [Acetobacter thailandicus]MBS0959795.1 hypothetical protein [Acetobacter thailandicus]
MAITKARKRRPIVYTPQFQDNGPTAERLAKGNFSPGKPPKDCTVIETLLKSQDITQDAANAADRWFRSWVFAYHGYIENPADYISNENIRHDDLSWLMTRANATGDIYDVRHALGMCGEVRLKSIMVDKLSFRDMAASLFPTISIDLGRKKVSAQCCLILEQLAEFYEAQAKKRAKEIRENLKA